MSSRGVLFFLLLVFSLLRGALAQNSTSTPSPPLFSGIELKSLLSLRASLGLRARDWPLKRDPCSSWIGVRCRGGRVVALNISGFRRTRIGRLSPRFSVEGIQNLSSLAAFNASGFPLPGSIPDWFGSLLPPSLAVLDLRGCEISSSIPLSLGNASGIQELYLGGNRLTGSLPPSLDGLSNLTILDLSGNSLTGPIHPRIALLSRLKILKLSANYFSGGIPPEIGNLSSLATLELGFNQLSGSVPGDLSKLRSLLELDVSNNSLSGSLPENLFPRLRLRSLKLSHNNFSGELPNSLLESTGLQFLDISYNNFSGILPLVPKDGAISAVLNLSHNSFYGFLPDGSIFERFKIADLSGNYFQGQAPVISSPNNSFDLNCFNNTANQRSFEECSEFYSLRGITFRPTPTPNATNPARVSSRKNLKYILGGVFGGIGLLIILILLFVCWKRKCGGGAAKRKEESTPATSVEAPPPALPANIAAVGDSFTLDQILLATGNFDDSNLIKRGHSGDIYRGFLEGGAPMAVKKIILQESKKESYQNELEFFAKHSSNRIVPFVGHSLEDNNQKILVYKYMPNRDLSSSLFRKSGQEGEGLQSLDWITRLKIAIGVAEALCYLHHECSPPLVHRDLQASSILLDDKFEVRLGSLSDVCPQEGEPHQRGIARFLRKASELGASGAASATCSYDVYCLGKVLLELVTGKLGISGSNDAATNEYLEKTLPYISVEEKDLVTKILDPSLVLDDDLLEEVWAMAIIARSCLNPKPSKRPLVRYILKALENPLKVVRQDPSSTSGRLRATSSRGSWNAALFGSWRQSSSEITTSMAGPSREGPSSKISGNSQGSNGERSFSRRKLSKEIFPEPPGGGDLDVD